MTNIQTSAQTNKAWRFHKTGGPEELRLDTLPMPEPNADEVLVRNLAFGLNRSDLLWMAGAFYPPHPPEQIGYEVCGIIERVGAKVKDFKPGDRISNFVNFYIGDYGNFGEHAVLPAKCLMHTPEQLSAAQGAAYAMYFTSYLALREMGDLRAYQTVLITAASSAAGMTAVSVARKIGATVIATTRSREKVALLQKAGADHVIVTQEEDLVARVQSITAGRGADMVFDCVAGPQVAQLINATAYGGHVIFYGVLDTQPVTLNWYEMMAHLPRIDFFTVPRYTGDDFFGQPAQHQATERAKRFIVGGVADGSLPVHIAKEFMGIEALPDALRFMQQNVAGGKIVVTL